jgi:23S rRNA pseudouridine2457 synthase
MSEQHHHYILHKPYGYISQFITNGEVKKRHKFLGELFDFPPKTMSIGRLDLDSEGLLFLTTDGMMSHQVRNRKVEKEYYCQVDGIISEEALEKLRNGIEISTEDGKYMTLPGKAEKISDPGFAPRVGKKVRDDRHGPTSWVSIIICEGKFRQVRKMTAAVGFPTLRLVRYRIADITLDQLALGEVKEVPFLID